jgi:outer membrane protein assembly factor BamB
MVDISADPLVKDNTVYVITYQGKMAAVNIPSGNLVWEREISSYHNMAMDEKQLYVTDNSHHLYAIDRETGATLWKQSSLAERYITGPAVIDGMVAVADRGGYIHFLSGDKGLIMDQLHVSGKIYQDPVVVGKTLLVNTHSGKLADIHLAPANGSV